MASADWLRTQGKDFKDAVETLANFYSSEPAFLPPTSGQSCNEVLDATRRIVAISDRVRTLLAGPSDFIQHLAQQIQLLASIKWLGDQQILAGIPLSGDVLLKDVADLAGVPEIQLRRIARMTATSGFLKVVGNEKIGHTNLSASFVMDLSLSDAITFLAETSTPTALRMNAAKAAEDTYSTEKYSAYCTAFDTSKSFRRACLERPKLQRQWRAYRRHTGYIERDIANLIDWSNLEDGLIVEACVHSGENAVQLAERYSAHQVIFQTTRSQSSHSEIDAASSLTESSRGRISIQSRVPGAVQTIKHAAVYIIRVNLSTPNMRSHIISELRAHLGVLRKNTSSTLVLAPPLLPTPNVVDPDVELKARLRDVCHAQLNNEWHLEMEDLLDIIGSVYDNKGKLVIVDQVFSDHHVVVALALKYQDLGVHS